ncbi:MAG: hypothetical protein JWN74_1251 [Acidobacteriaceae bacterium]|nr:hypothetical protein [Acidobacteriaceae bacterium]
MNKWIKKMVDNALGIGVDLDFSDLSCDNCESVAHAEINIHDAKTHDDAVILRALCDPCFKDELLTSCWVHKEVKSPVQPRNASR